MKPKRSGASLKPQTKTTMILATGIALVLGAVVGVGGFTFVYAKGGSYLGNDPKACADCHVEALRIFGESINFAGKGQLALRPPK